MNVHVLGVVSPSCLSTAIGLDQAFSLPTPPAREISQDSISKHSRYTTICIVGTAWSTLVVRFLILSY